MKHLGPSKGPLNFGGNFLKDTLTLGDGGLSTFWITTLEIVITPAYTKLGSRDLDMILILGWDHLLHGDQHFGGIAQSRKRFAISDWSCSLKYHMELSKIVLAQAGHRNQAQITIPAKAAHLQARQQQVMAVLIPLSVQLAVLCVLVLVYWLVSASFTRHFCNPPQLLLMYFL